MCPVVAAILLANLTTTKLAKQLQERLRKLELAAQQKTSSQQPDGGQPSKSKMPHNRPETSRATQRT
jgi:hypothetical protein